MSWSIVVFTYIKGPKNTAVDVAVVDGFATDTAAITAATAIRAVVPPDWGTDAEANVKTVLVEKP